MPRIAGQWSDLNPSGQGTVQSVSAASGLTVQFMGVVEWGASATVSFDIVFANNGDISIANHSVSGGWGTATVVGFSPGGGAAGNSVTWSSLVGGTTSYSANQAVYQFVNNGSPSGFSSITMDSSNNMTVN